MAHCNCPSINRVVDYGLRLVESLSRGGSHDLRREQAVLTNLLLEVDGKAPAHLGPRYALTCWLDELLTCYPPWTDEWNEHKLETTLYGGNDRAWRFWQEAKQAETLRDSQLLSVYYLCAALGFRGRLRDDAEKFAGWMDCIRVRVTHVSQPAPTCDAPPPLRRATHQLRGRNRLAYALVAASIALVCVLPIATYALVQQLCS